MGDDKFPCCRTWVFPLGRRTGLLRSVQEGSHAGLQAANKAN